MTPVALVLYVMNLLFNFCMVLLCQDTECLLVFFLSCYWLYLFVS